MIELIIFFIIYLILNTLENYYRERWKYERTSILQAKYSRLWHSVQFIRWLIVLLTVSILLLGVNSRLIILLPLSGIWKIFFDGLLNLLRGKSFWYQSQYKNLSFLEKYSTKTNKIIFLIISILIAIILME